MEDEREQVFSLSTEAGLAEERMLREELVREMVARISTCWNVSRAR